MLILFVSAVFIVSALLIGRSRPMGAALILWLWILFGWSYGNADYFNYQTHFHRANHLTGFEAAYTLVEQTFRNLGLTYQQFLIVVAFLFVMAVAYVCIRNTRNWYFVLALFLVYPFMMDVVQVRNSMALIFVYLGLSYLFSHRNKRGALIYTVLIAIAVMFHSGSLIFLAALLPVFMKPKTLRITTAVLIISMLIASPLLKGILLAAAALLHVQNRLMVYLAVSNGGIMAALTSRKTFIIVVLYLSYTIGYLYLKRHSQFNTREQNEKLELIQGINTIMLVTIPLSLYMPDIYRSISALALFNYIVWANYTFGKDKYIYPQSELFVLLYSLAAAALNIYILVISSQNINTVFFPFINQNLLLR